MTIHLHTQTGYSILDSTVQVEELIQYAKSQGTNTLAITDHNVLLGAAEFIRLCRKENIKPIVGMEVDCAYEEGKIIPFLLITGDNIGYQNLCKLSTIINQDKHYCTKQQLIDASKHNTLIVYGEGGLLDQQLIDIENHREEVYDCLMQLKKEFSSFYVALSYQDALLWRNSNQELKRIASAAGLPTVALNKIYYLKENDYEAYRAVCAIRTHKFLDDPSLTVKKGRYFLSQKQMEQLYDSDDLFATEKIAQACVASYELDQAHLPSFPTPQDISSRQYLEKLCIAGLKKRCNGNVSDAYIRRLKHELNIIFKMHFEDYFLIVYDYIRFARKNGINVGPGRGSSAGSLVAYCLGITMIDPLQYDLLFERFLNPDRVTMPDIDTDFPDNRRGEVISYVIEKYGKEHVANVVVFQSFGSSGVIRDLGRIYRIRSMDIDMIVRCIQRTREKNLSLIYEKNATLRQIIQSDTKLQNLFDIAVKLEGLPRSVGQHPAGVIISKENMMDKVPLIRLSSTILTSQFEADYLEERGLIKMDILSLKNLATIQKIVDAIQQKYPDFSLNQMSLQNPEIYKIFAKGDTVGIFQFESDDMKKMLRQLQPSSFDDIIAANALNRPSAMGNIKQFIENREHPENIQYLHPALKPILASTHGIMLYQEQTMLTAQVIAGFSMGKADILRKAIAKKEESEMKRLRNDFMNGARNNHIDEHIAEEIWDMIDDFGSYGFNKSHSVAYSIISCQCAWLKAEYPLYFYQSLLDSVIGDQHKTALYIDESRRKNISVAYPNVNISTDVYRLYENTLYLPLGCIKEINVNFVRELIKERQNNGLYKNFQEFVARVMLLHANQKMLESMIDAGALDCFKETRKTMRENLAQIIGFAEIIQTTTDRGKGLDFSLVSVPVLTKYHQSAREKVINEKNALGFTLSNEEISSLRKALHIQDPSLAAIGQSYNQEVQSFGMIEKIFEYTSKNNRKYCRMIITDGMTDVNVGVWPSDYAKLKDSLKEGVYIRFHGKMDETGNIQASKIATIRRDETNGKNTNHR